MEADLLGVFSDHMARSYQEQVWAVAVVASMNGFIISQASTLRAALKPSLLIWGVRAMTSLALLFIWSRHGIYLYYDDLAKRVIAAGPGVALPDLTFWQAASGIVLRWSGVLLYTLIVIGMSYAALQVLKARETAGRQEDCG